jgi:inner membrane transporter RhtA
MVFFQSGGALAVHLFPYVGSAGASLIRLGMGAIILCSLTRPQWRDLEINQVRAVIPFGLAVGTMNLCFYEAIDRIPFGTAITIQFLGPLTVALMTRRRRLDLLWIALAALGILALVSPESDTGPELLGYLFAVLGATGWGAYILMGKRLGATFADGSGVALGMVVASTVPLVPALATAGSATFSPIILPLGFAVAMLSTVVPHTADVEALRRLPAHAFGILMSMEPVMALLVGAVFLGQSPSLQQLAGVVLVAAAALGVMRAQPVPPSGEHV